MVPDVRPCALCTFENSPGVLQCEMCGGDLERGNPQVDNGYRIKIGSYGEQVFEEFSSAYTINTPIEDRKHYTTTSTGLYGETVFDEYPSRMQIHKTDTPPPLPIPSVPVQKKRESVEDRMRKIRERLREEDTKDGREEDIDEDSTDEKKVKQDSEAIEQETNAKQDQEDSRGMIGERKANYERTTRTSIQRSVRPTRELLLSSPRLTKERPSPPSRPTREITSSHILPPISLIIPPIHNPPTTWKCSTCMHNNHSVDTECTQCINTLLPSNTPTLLPSMYVHHEQASKTVRLMEAMQLKIEGAITQQEFNQRKARIMNH